MFRDGRGAGSSILEFQGDATQRNAEQLTPSSPTAATEKTFHTHGTVVPRRWSEGRGADRERPVAVPSTVRTRVAPGGAEARVNRGDSRPALLAVMSFLNEELVLLL
jgi:hypothetical protein